MLFLWDGDIRIIRLTRVLGVSGLLGLKIRVLRVIKVMKVNWVIRLIISGVGYSEAYISFSVVLGCFRIIRIDSCGIVVLLRWGEARFA